MRTFLDNEIPQRKKNGLPKNWLFIYARHVYKKKSQTSQGKKITATFGQKKTITGQNT